MQQRIIAAPSANDNWKRVIHQVVLKLKKNDYPLFESARIKEVKRSLTDGNSLKIYERLDRETLLINRTADMFNRAVDNAPWMVFKCWNEMGFSGRDVAKEGFGLRLSETFVTKIYLEENRFPSFNVDVFRTSVREILAARTLDSIDVDNTSDSEDESAPIKMEYHDGTQAGRLTALIEKTLLPAWNSDSSVAFRVRSQLLTILTDELGVRVKIPTSLDDNTFELKSLINHYLSRPRDVALA